MSLTTAELSRFIANHFSLEDIRQLCMELGIDFDDLPGNNARGKARELVKYTARRGRRQELESLCQKERPSPSPEVAPPPQPPPPRPPAPPSPAAPPPPRLNLYTVTNLLRVFFDEAEQAQLAETLGEEHTHFQPSPSQKLHPLVEKLDEQGRLEALLDAARQQRPDLPWKEATVTPGLVAIRPPRPPDAIAMVNLIAGAFPDRQAFHLFCRQHIPAFLGAASPDRPMRSQAREFVQFMQRRGRLQELLSTMETTYPAQYEQYAPYAREEKQYERAQREVKENLAMSNEAARIINAEIMRREKDSPDGFILRQTLPLDAKKVLKSLAWMSRGESLFALTTDKVMQTWDVTQGQALPRFKTQLNKDVWFAAPMPDGKHALLIAGPFSAKRKLRSQRLSDGKVRLEIDNVPQKANVAAISPDGAWAVTRGDGNSLHIWDLEKAYGRAVLHGHLREVTRVLVTPDGERIISAARDETIRIWSAKGELLHTLEGHSSEISNLTLSPNGQLLASTQEDSCQIYVWRLPKRQRGFMARFQNDEPKLATKLDGHRNQVTALSFAAGGRFLASKSNDYTVRLWRCATWETAAQMMETRGPAIAFHPHKPLLATGGAAGTVIRVWEIAL